MKLRGGIYHVFIKDWLKVFPRNQMYFVHYDTYKINRTSEIDNTLDFIGLGKKHCFTQMEDDHYCWPMEI